MDLVAKAFVKAGWKRGTSLYNTLAQSKSLSLARRDMCSQVITIKNKGESYTSPGI